MTAVPLPGWAVVSPDRLRHIERVAALVSEWAARMDVPPEEAGRWRRAVGLHDALRDAPEDALVRWAPDTPGPSELRHGPASAARAAAEGERDAGVLDAVRYHSVGWADWELVGQVLYCADYLEPGRRFAREHRQALAARFPHDPGGVLRQVATDRLAHLVASGWPLPEPTVGFWNSLHAPSASR